MFLFPLLLLPFFRYRNLISSYHIDDRRERIIPLLTSFNSLLHNFIHSLQVSDPFFPEIIHFCHIRCCDSCVDDQFLVEDFNTCSRSRGAYGNSFCPFIQDAYSADLVSAGGYTCKRTYTIIPIKA